jgi:elongator complex protein 1
MEFHESDSLFPPANCSPRSQAEPVGSIAPGIAAMAWSPDQEVVMIVNGDGALLVMTQDFDILSEAPLDQTDFGQQAPVALGWGKVETQFRGSAGKMTGPAAAVKATRMDQDDGRVRISWRGDGQYCAVLSLSLSSSARVLRVWGRDGSLQSTGESVDRMGGLLAWRPSGSLIAGVQQVGARMDVVFFERNGLRHGEFTLTHTATDATVRELLWTSDSSVLAVWLSRRGAGDCVQLWTVGNYHWCGGEGGAE